MSVKSVQAIASYGETIDTSYDNSSWVGEGHAPNLLHTTDYTMSVTALDDAGNKAVLSEPIPFTVAAKWLTPKTNWACHYDMSGKYIGDYFNIVDWRRIIGNLYYLKELADKMYPPFPFGAMAEGKQYSDIPYANEWNAIERNLDSFVKYTYPFKIGKTRTYHDEMSAPNYDDLNRIESASLLIFQGLTSQYENIKVLPYILGGDEFGN